MENKIYIFGHRNPDTDSVTSAIALSYLKNQLGYNTEPAVLSSINQESKFVLNYFNVKTPIFLNDVKLKIKDCFYYKDYTINETDSIYNAYNKMENKWISKIPVIDKNKKYLGIVSMSTIAKYMISQSYNIESTYDNILEVLKAEELLRFNDTIKGNIIFSNYNDNYLNEINLIKENILITNNLNLIDKAINKKIKLLILTNNIQLEDNYLKLLNKNKINCIKTSYDFVKVVKLINYSNNASTIMNQDKVMTVNEYTDLSDFINLANKNRLSYYVMLNDKKECKGIIRFSDIGYGNKKKVILVDHNSYSQSAIGIEETEILEIIDHHNIGNIGTNMPISFRNVPVGSTNTIIYSMYKENNIKIPYEIAGLMLSGILSDTLILKSPTTTEKDKEVVKNLSKLLNIDYEEYGFQMLKSGSSLKKKTKEEILTYDFKEYPINDLKIGLGQINIVNIKELSKNKKELTRFLNKYASTNNYHFVILIATDIVNNGSYIFYSDKADEVLEGAFDIKFNQGTYLQDVISRKQQILPKIMLEMEKY